MEQDKTLFRNMLKGLKYGYYIAVIILLVNLALAGKLAFAQTSAIEYDFVESVRYDWNGEPANDTLNFRNGTIYTGDFNGTYSFDDSVELDDWNLIESGGSIDIIDQEKGHNTVLKIADTDNGDFVFLWQNIEAETNGTIEYYWLSSDTSQQNVFELKLGGSLVLYLRMDSGKFQYNDGSWNDVGRVANLNVWYHIQINFETTTGSYMGLSQYDWNIEINGVSYGDYDFINNVSGLLQPAFWTDTTDFNYYFLIDAIGYSWDGIFWLYNGTYTFTDDVIGGIPTDWQEGLAHAGGSYNVNKSFYGHNNIFGFYPDSGLYTESYLTIKPTDLGDIEYWVGSTNVNEQVVFSLNSDPDYPQSTRAIMIYTASGFLWCAYGDGGGSLDYVNIPIVNNTWYHVRISFNTIYDNVSVWLDEVLKVDSENFSYDNEFDSTDLDSIVISAYRDFGYYACHFDAFGFTWYDGYDVGDNLQLYNIYNYFVGENYNFNIQYTGETVIDKFEFAYNGYGELHDEGVDNPNTWTDIEDSGGDQVNIRWGGDIFDRHVRIVQSASGDSGIEKDFEIPTATFINISSFILLYIFGNPNATYDVDVYSYDETLIARIRFEMSWTNNIASLLYYDGSSYHYLRTDFGLDEEIFFNMFIFNGRVVLRVWNIGLVPFYTSIYEFDVLDETKDGLGHIRCYSDMPSVSSNNEMGVDYMGVYVDGVSYAIDFGVASYQHTGYWDHHYENLVVIDVDGVCSINADNFDYIPYDNYTTIQTVNLWDSGFYGFTSLGEVAFGIVSNESFILNGFKVYGVNITDGINTARLSYTYSGIENDDESYFYFQNDRLYYTFTSNDSNLEYMYGSFDITDFDTLNRTIATSFYKSIASLYAELRVLYVDDVFSKFELERYISGINEVLPQDKTVDKIEMYVSDDDNDYNATLTGYYQSITFPFIPDISTSLTTLSFLLVIPMLIILIGLPLIVSNRLKRPMLFLPFVVIFAVIGMATNIVPAFVGISIIVGVIAFYIIKQKTVGG